MGCFPQTRKNRILSGLVWHSLPLTDHITARHMKILWEKGRGEIAQLSTTSLKESQCHCLSILSSFWKGEPMAFQHLIFSFCQKLIYLVCSIRDQLSHLLQASPPCICRKLWARNQKCNLCFSGTNNILKLWNIQEHFYLKTSPVLYYTLHTLILLEMQLQAGTIFRSVLGAFKDAFEDCCVMLSC